MNRLSICTALVVCLSACSATSTQFDWDKQFDFAPLKTWSWMEQPKGHSPEELVTQRVVAAVEKQLAEQGYQKVDGTADFQVGWNVRSREKVRVSDSGFRDPYWTGYYGPRSVDVNYYEEGTLIIDVSNPVENRVVWRGIATRALSNDPSPDEADGIIADAVKKIFASFPPKS